MNKRASSDSAPIAARLRILPLLVIVALLVFAVRLGETFTHVKDLEGAAVAETAAPAHAEKPAEKPAEAAATHTAEKPADKPADKTDAHAEAVPPAQSAAPAEAEAKPALSLPEVWSSATDEVMATSPERENLLKDLSKRRADLDKREADLAQREAVLAAAQKQIDSKMADMAKLKGDLEKLLGQQSQEEEAQTKSLVKIYEGMKPKDAARIFNELDMDVLLPVASRMSTLRIGPVLAQMDAEKAKELTTRLAELKKLPAGADAPSMPKAGGDLGIPANLPGIDNAAAPKTP